MISCVVLDYDRTLADPTAPYEASIGMRQVTNEAADVIRALHRLGLRLILGSNCHTTRRWALQWAGVADLFASLVMSYDIGFRKPDPHFYAEVIRRAKCDPARILFAGDRLDNDVTGPLNAGMQAALIGQHPGPALSSAAHHLASLRDLPDLVTHLSRQPSWRNETD